MSNKTRKAIKPVYVAEDFNIEPEAELPSAPIESRPRPEKMPTKRVSPRTSRREEPVAATPEQIPETNRDEETKPLRETRRHSPRARAETVSDEQTDTPRNHSPRNIAIGIVSVENARSQQETLRILGLQLNHAIASRDANYFHVTSRDGRDAYIKTPEQSTDTKQMSPRTRGMLVRAKKITAVHYPLEMREKALNSCQKYCTGVAIRNKERSAITFVEPDGYDTHFFEVDSDTPLPILHFDTVVREEEGVHALIAKATNALEYHTMDAADGEINAFLEQFVQIQKGMQGFSKRCDEIISAYTTHRDDTSEEAQQSRLDLVRKYSSIARKLEASRGLFVELRQVIDELAKQ